MIPPPGEDRLHVALLLGLQVVRTHEFRLLIEELGDIYNKSWLSSLSDGEIKQRLRGHDGDEPSAEDVARLKNAIENVAVVPSASMRVVEMLKVTLDTLAPLLFSRSWHLFVSSKPMFITGDHPVVTGHGVNGVLRPVDGGFGLAQWVFVPLDPTHTLALSLDDSLREQVVFITPAEVKAINTLVTELAHEWIFYHPKHAKVLTGFRPRAQRPVMYLNGMPIHRHQGWPAVRQQSASGVRGFHVHRSPPLSK